jgi:hypothetical protein
MKKTDMYQQQLAGLSDWDGYLLQESGLPCPRGNLELAQVVAEMGDQMLFERYVAFDADRAPTNDPGEFLAFCGVLGYGRLCAEGQTHLLVPLRQFAADPRWRIREAVAMALHWLGRVDMEALLTEMQQWSQGNPLEQRAAAAALCHPDLLEDPGDVEQVLQILDSITASVAQAEDRRSDEFQVLRKGLGYCWGVAVSACPAAGKRKMERWFASEDRDVRWIMRQNLSKKRLERMDGTWVATWRSRIGR